MIKRTKKCILLAVVLVVSTVSAFAGGTSDNTSTKKASNPRLRSPSLEYGHYFVISAVENLGVTPNPTFSRTVSSRVSISLNVKTGYEADLVAAKASVEASIGYDEGEEVSETVTMPVQGAGIPVGKTGYFLGKWSYWDYPVWGDWTGTVTVPNALTHAVDINVNNATSTSKGEQLRPSPGY